MVNQKNQKVDVYLSAGCGRCHLVNTPECKVHNWTAELAKLREIVLGCGLAEELKWGHPVYTFDKNNVVLLGAFKENCVISFFKGSLLKDERKILQKPGENTQAGRVIRFTDVRRIVELENILKDYIFEAVEIEKKGIKTEFRKVEEYEITDEFQNKLNENANLNSAFTSLTPGRRKAYLMYFSQPKQSKTRQARIEKCLPKILAGKGLTE